MTDSAKKSQKSDSKDTDSTKAFDLMSGDAQKMWLNMGTETMRFLASRMQQDLETQKAMLACTSLEDIQKVQGDYYTQTLEDYRSQMSRVMEIMSEVTPKGLENLQFITRRGYDDVPL